MAYDSETTDPTTGGLLQGGAGAATLAASLAGGPAAPAIAAGLPAALQLYAFLRQSKQRRNLKPQDVTPEAVKEATALARQQAGAQLPGYGQAVNQLHQQTANSTAAAGRGAASSGQLLSALAAIDQNTKAGMNQLAAQNEQYQASARAGLQRQLGVAGQWQEQGRQEDARTKAALDQSRFANLQGGLSTLGQGAMYALAARRGAAPTPEMSLLPTPATPALAPPFKAGFEAPAALPYYQDYTQRLQRRAGIPSVDYSGN